ncbi:c-type cytochrome [Glaciecola sp. SC05]|uniref:c-type cytochrome n=1 Tax=Glaciecola sp. SC05 TaxID=1987355 RepID=UPI0035296127
MNKVNICIIASLIALLMGCGKGADSPTGFSLPEGNVDAGKLVFIKHQCMACHTLDGMDDSTIDSPLTTKIRLGGASPKITTYAELVTSIINPSHRISKGPKWETTNEDTGESLMQNYNDVMTVTELIDIVAFLQPEYRVTPMPYTPYSHYYIP